MTKTSTHANVCAGSFFFLCVYEREREREMELLQEGRPCSLFEGIQASFLVPPAVPGPSVVLPWSACKKLAQLIMSTQKVKGHRSVIGDKYKFTSPNVNRVALSATQAKEPSVCFSITCQGPAKRAIHRIVMWPSSELVGHILIPNLYLLEKKRTKYRWNNP